MYWAAGRKNRWWNLGGRVAVLRVFCDPDDFVGSRILLVQISKMFSDGFFVFEEFLGEGLVDHGNVPGSGGVLFRNPPTFHNFGADALEVAVNHPHPPCLILINPGPTAPL